MANHPLPLIPGYTLTEQIYAGARTAVYRATSEQGKSVAIKVLRSPYPSINELVRFRNQYVIAKNLEIPGIVKPLDLVPWNHSYALIAEDVGGVALQNYVQIYGRLSIEQVLTVALQLADGLHLLGQHRVLHKDINPANILIHPDTHQIWLIDFSLASLLPKESLELQGPQALEGTLAYIAPEQTGRMNRGIDYRTDFYGLGVTLYELLVGELPFQHDEPMELIHCHLAKVPVPPCEFVLHPPVPKVLSDIVLKLMAKNAEDRYQSALGLKHDLQRCLHQWQTSGQIEAFELGQEDRCDRFLIPEKLYGREVAVQTLLNAFERVSQGSSELVLVSGFSGIGKTAVINEVHKPITRQHGYFIKGKFDQFNHNTPFSAFVQAFRSLMGQLLGESDVTLAAWKTKILTAVGKSGQVLIEVIPELERIIGKQPDVLELSGNAAQNRFNLLFGKFIRVFTKPEHPLIIFLDDLQWVDSASLSLFKLLMDEGSGYLLMLGAYRDNEVSPAHPLMLELHKIRQQGITMSTITITPLEGDDINLIVADSLHCSRETALPLSQLAYQKARGNPFFTIQFLQGLAGDGLITFNANNGYWQCDLARVRQLALTDDVVTFMVERIQKLPEATQNVLKMAACIGNEFDLRTLAVVCEQTQDEVAVNLWRSLQVGLVIPANETYKFFQGARHASKTLDKITVSYRFLHDRVQQATYSLIPKKQRQNTHYKIGQLLFQSSSQEQIEGSIFDIVKHLNQGVAPTLTHQEKKLLAELNLVAGKKALLSTAYASAAQYLNISIGLLNEDSWEKEYKLTLSIFTSKINAEYLSINFPVAKALADFATEKIINVLDRINLYELQIQMYMAQAEAQKALDLGNSALELLGVNLEQAPDAAEIQLPSLSSIDSLPVMQDTHQIAIMRILIAMLSPAYIVQPDLLSPMMLTMIDLSLQKGHISLSAQAYMWYGLYLCTSQRDLEKGYYCGLLALKVLERFPSEELECSIENLFNVFIRPWKEPLVNSIKPLEKAREIGLRTGDFEFASYATAHRCTYLFLSGENLTEVQKQQGIAMEALHRVKQAHSLSHASIWQQLTYSLQGNQSDSRDSNNSFSRTEQFTNFHNDKDRSLVFTSYLAECILEYLLGNYSSAIDAAANAETESNVAIGITAITYRFYYSLSILALKSAGKDPLSSEYGLVFPVEKDTQDLFSKLEDNQRFIKEWASVNPGHAKHKHYLIEAEYHRRLDRKADAIELFDRAISTAKINGYLQEEGLANELAARFYLDWGKDKVAAAYMHEAYYCYVRWGAQTKVDDLEKRYPTLLESVLVKREQPSASLIALSDVVPVKISKHSSLSSSQVENSGINEKLDLITVLKAARALTESIDLNELLQKISQLMLQVSGADRLALILPQANDSWQVRVSATSESTILIDTPLSNYADLPIQLIQYVRRTQEVLVVNNSDTDLPIIDIFLQYHQPCSILCLPIAYQGKLNGLLYLQNKSTTGVFNKNQISVISFLCSQASIALENAHLFKVQQKLSIDLQNKNAFLKAQQESSLDGMLVIDENRQVTAYNQRFVSIWNIPEAVLTTKDNRQLIDHVLDRLENPAEFLERVEYLYAHPEECSYGQIHLKDKRVLERYSSPVRSPSEDYCGRIWYFRDISDRKATEVALQDAQNQFRRITENIPGMIHRYVLHADGSDAMTYVDSQVRDIFEVEPEAAIQNVDFLWQRFHPDDISMIRDRLRISAEELNPFTFESRLLLPQKGLKWIQISAAPERLDNGDIIWDGVAIDISDRKQAETELQEVTERLSLALRSGDLGYWQWMIANSDLYWDDRLYELHGIPKNKLNYSIFRDSIHHDDAVLFEELVQHAIANEHYENEFGRSVPFEVIYRAVCPDGEINYLKTYGTVLRNSTGEATGMLGVTFNITHFKLAEAQLALSNQELKRANRMKDEFLATMSHELRTPLNAVLGMTEILQEQVLGAINPKQLDMLNTIEKSGRHLLQLINDILDLSKISAGKIELSPDFIDVTRLCNASLQLIQPQARNKGIRTIADIAANMPTIAMDEQRMRQVLINLLSNAVKFTPERGQITLHVEAQPVPDPTGVCPQGCLRITVSDTGIGIAPAHMDKLFQPFVQIDSALNRQYAGTGLGLALVKQIVELHGGKVTVTSEVDVGSSFTVDLPWIAAPTAPTTKASATTANTAQLQATKAPIILLVEDDPANRITISDYLEAKGYQLVTAKNGRDAIDLVQTLHPKVVLMDIQMPGMDGLEATRYIRQTLGLADIPIIALTALAMTGDRERCLEAGATQYLSKPVKLKQLEACLRDCLAP